MSEVEQSRPSFRRAEDPAYVPAVQSLKIDRAARQATAECITRRAQRKLSDRAAVGTFQPHQRKTSCSRSTAGSAAVDCRLEARSRNHPPCVAWTPRFDTLFLDAGGVLLFPNWERVSETLNRHGIAISPDALLRAEPAMKFAIDATAQVESTSDADRGGR